METRHPDFRVDELLSMAAQATGLDDFGPDSFRPGLERLVAAINALRLTEMGMVRARNMIVGNLIARLGVWDHRKRHPEVAGEVIQKPMFVVGLPRTGTTLLFGLLAQDPDHRVPMLWETSIPCPPPEADSYETDPRIEMVTQGLLAVDGLNPAVLAVHPIGAQLPQECIGIFSMEFLSYIYYCGLPIRDYNDWLDSQDMGAVYRWHKMFLQHLQSRHRKQRWALKAPSHMEFMADLFASYTDALIINTHRSPVDAVASHSSLHWHLWEQSLGAFDKKEVGPQTAEMMERWLQRFVDWRNAHPEKNPQIADIAFGDLVADPIGMVKAIYRRFGLPVSTAFESRMADFLVANRQDKFGTHRYTPEEFGLNRAELVERFRFYTDRFDVLGRR
ncbi:sulfotransferase family protein [Denitratisoma oestradiolicum]|uniref:Sulfotransferase n=1 Tax=Denitratisoma oestradiolicum TaxID=311182 RepID=A0A6S6XYS2_9PROT|nr:sulfotransferase [Denitratisoma oestradiolicum]TWO79832.1 hypothetical protein CBW56_13010 [Denitratisoma oestradiolicum]CAB1369527.1 conserved protein of unknown function [Denitratisoma oestradiolicum]